MVEQPTPMHEAQAETADSSEASADDHPLAEQLSATSLILETLTGLLLEIDQHPDQYVLGKWGNALGWRKAPPEVASIGNAAECYVVDQDGHRLLVASDGTNSVLSIAIGAGFDRAEFIGACSKVFALTKTDDTTEFGQRVEVFRLATTTRVIGVLVVSTATIESAIGTGSVAYMSAERFRSETGHDP